MVTRRTLSCFALCVMLFTFVMYFAWNQDTTMLSFRKQPSSINSAKPHASFANAAIVILVDSRQKRIQSLCEGLRALERNLISRYPYPVILFHEKRLKAEDRNLLSNCSSVETQYIELSFSSNVDRVRPNINCSTCSKGYLNMIHFFFLDIILHPAIRDLEYFMRLDTDSQILSPFPYDPFEYMRTHGKHYGFRQRGLTPRMVSRKMWPFVKRFLSGQKIVAAQPWNFTKRNPRVPYFYNNFEIVDVKRFQQIDVFSFLHRVAESQNIYRYRWGDAPLRWLTVHIFFHHNQTQFFCDFDYRHKNVVWRSVVGGNEKCKGEESSPGERVPFSAYEKQKKIDVFDGNS